MFSSRFNRQKAHEPAAHPAIERARMIANLMDSAFTLPIIRKRIGLDPLLGLLPVSGDVISAAISLYIIYLAFELGLPRPVLLRMGLNTLFDLLIGLIPVVGELSDAFIKSNQWNVQILEEAYKELSADLHRGKTVVVDVQAEPV